jgi:HD-like signal output (HDOD) protein
MAQEIKKRICFAGFTGAELETLQPSLKGLDAVWTCVFSADAAAALKAMSSTAFDVMVVNLAPGGIAPAGLLHEAAVQYPRMLRFILGEVGDRELIVDCMGAAHQFISRPWRPPELISIIERSFALDAWLSNDKLRVFIPRLGTLPGLPATYFEVLKRAESPNSSVESVAEVIARDPALTARLLQMVNSPACGLAEKITSPHEAVARLGLDTVKSFVLCLQLFCHPLPAGAASVSLDELWRHSFSVAKIAAKIVVRCIASERMASEAYTAGLLHNIGQIVLATNLSREYSAVIEAARRNKWSLPEAELNQLGVTSNQVGAYLLGLWGMPLPLVEAVALHCTPGVVTPAEFTVLTVVHVANVLAQDENGLLGKLQPPKLDAAYLAALDLPKKPDAWRKLLASTPTAESQAENRTPARSKASPSPQPHSLRFKLFTLAAVSVIAIAIVVAFKWRSARATSPAADPATEAGVASAPAVPATESPLDTVQVQSILYNPSHPVVVINHQALERGAHFNGMEILSISPTSVVLSYQGRQKTFSLK